MRYSEKTLQETGGLGTVATRADIIDKLFGSYLIEKKENVQLCRIFNSGWKIPQDYEKRE